MGRFAAVFVAVMVVFLVAPEIDIAVSALFHDSAQGRFPLASTAGYKDLRDSVEILTIAVAASVLLLLAAHLWHRRPLANRRGRTLLFFVVTLAVGPLLVVNIGLKDNVGRARPAQTALFKPGGTAFTPAFVPSRSCARNCSFVSGDVAAAFALLAIPMALRGTGGSHLADPLRAAVAERSARRRARLRRGLVAGILAYGIVVAFLRVSVGAHFLSDVIIAALLSSALTWLMFRLVVVQGLVWMPRVGRDVRAARAAFGAWLLATLPGLRDFR